MSIPGELPMLHAVALFHKLGVNQTTSGRDSSGVGGFDGGDDSGC